MPTGYEGECPLFDSFQNIVVSTKADIYQYTNQVFMGRDQKDSCEDFIGGLQGQRW